MRHRLTKKADADIAGILRTTRKLFGKNQVVTYAGIIDEGIAMIEADPSRPACRPQDELGVGVKSMHLEHVRVRRGSAAHLIFFLEKTTPSGEGQIVIVGVLHERMIPRRHLAQVLRDEISPGSTFGMKS